MRKIIKVAFAAAVVAMAGYGVYTNQKTDIMSDVMLANVEALASGEGSSSDCEVYCKSDYRYTCYIYWGDDTEGTACPNHRKK